MRALKFVHLAIDKEAKLPERLANRQITQIPLDVLVKYIADPYGLDIIQLVDMIMERRCRKCGCTQSDCSQCIEKTGMACHWVEDNLCSACIPGGDKKIQKFYKELDSIRAKSSVNKKPKKEKMK